MALRSTLRVVRSNKRKPSACSSLSTRRDSAGCDMCSASAVFVRAAEAIDRAAAAAIEAGEATRDVGGRLGTAETGRALAHRLLLA